MNPNTQSNYHERESRERWVDLRTIDEIEESHLNDLTHLQSTSRVKCCVVVWHQLEITDPKETRENLKKQAEKTPYDLQNQFPEPSHNIKS